MSEATKAAHWPRILNGWLIDETPWQMFPTWPEDPCITATHMLSGVQLVWRGVEGHAFHMSPMPVLRRVILEHPALKPRTLTQEMDHDEALAYIETTVLGPE